MASSMRYLDFELQIGGPTPDGRVIISASSEAGRCEGAAVFDRAQLAGLRREVAALAPQRSRRATPAFARAHELGAALFQALPDEVRDLYGRLRERARERGYGVRIKLSGQDPALVFLPWEFLHDGQDFLARSANTPVVRWPSADVSLPVSEAHALRVLAVVASPSELRTPGAAKEKQRLREALAGKPGVQLVFLDEKVPHVTLASVQQELRQAQGAGAPYHALHFIGHGAFARDASGAGEGYLVFEDEDGHAAPAGAAQVQWVIGDHPLRLAVLNACEGAQVDETDGLAGVALLLVRAGIPAVVAMQFEISGEAAIAFANEFYEALLDGYPVDAAVAEGRKAILRDLGEASIEWGTPVLFTRYLDGRLFDVGARPASAASISAPAAAAPAPRFAQRLAASRRAWAAAALLTVILIALALAQPGLRAGLSGTRPAATAAPEDAGPSDVAVPGGAVPGAGAAGAVCPTPPPLPPPAALDEMRPVPAATFIMGDNLSENQMERPEHEVSVAAFRMDRYEVTNLQYRRFVAQTGRAAPAHWQDGAFPADQAYWPVVNVTWDDARAYCVWAGKRLPTEAEWELACRGAGKRRYPWGAAWDAARANTRESSCRQPQPVGSYSPAGDSPFGVADMAGNVAEWVSSGAGGYPYVATDGREGAQSAGAQSAGAQSAGDENADRVLRGGSWRSTGDAARCAARAVGPPIAFQSSLGFRCAANP